MLAENVSLQIAAAPPASSVTQVGGKTAAEQNRRSAAGRAVAEATPPEVPGTAAGTPALDEPKSVSRLTYDDELSRTFVEIVDRRSGEVVHRYPPEEIVRHIDALIKQQHLRAGQRDTGFLVDQSA